jgi:hypothetical protein
MDSLKNCHSNRYPLCFRKFGIGLGGGLGLGVCVLKMPLQGLLTAINNTSKVMICISKFVQDALGYGLGHLNQENKKSP